MSKYKETAQGVLDNIGGKKNIDSVWHCATRLRFKLKDENKANTNAIEALNGVITVVKSAGQFQVVIGNAVENVYNELIKLTGTDYSTTTETDDKQKKKTNIFSVLMDFVSAVFTPFLGALAGAGILKGLLSLAVTMNWLSSKGGAYVIWNAAGDAIFYFLPIFLAITAARKLQVDQFVAASIAAALVYPTLTAIVTKGTIIHFFGIPIIPISYTTSVFPILLAIWGLSYLEMFLNKIFPEAIRNVFTPLFSMVIMVPLTLLVVGPIGTKLSDILAAGLSFMYGVSPAIAGGLLGAFHQVIVIFGLHWALITLMINNVATQGYDQWLPIICAAVMGQAGASFGVFLKTKDKKMKTLAGSAAITGLFGITEPSIYGVTLKLKKPFYCAMISSGIGGILIGSAQVHASTFTFPSLLAIPTYMGHGFIAELGGLAIAFFGAIILTYFFGVTNEKKADSDGNVKHDSSKIKVDAPIKGTAVAMKDVADPVFSSEAMGKGIAFKPEDDELVAPLSGTISAVFPTSHAIGITSDSGIELLLHIGIDTVQLKGKYFKTLVEQGQKVRMGETLIHFDRKKIADAGYDNIVMMIVTNSDQFLNVKDDMSNSALIIEPEINLNGENKASLNLSN